MKSLSGAAVSSTCAEEGSLRPIRGEYGATLWVNLTRGRGMSDDMETFVYQSDHYFDELLLLHV